MSIIKAIQSAVNKASRVLIVTHIMPDGDALGSLTAMGLALNQLGKQVTLVCNDSIPERFRYLAMIEAVQTAVDPPVDFDLIIALDCGDASRMGELHEQLDEPPSRPVINIDHHVTNTLFGTINLVDSKATATAEILFALLPQLGTQLTPEIAMCLLTGLVTDTLGFRTAGVKAETLYAASKLVEAGADLFMVTKKALSLKPFSTLLLWQKGLDNMKLEAGLLWTKISDKERKEAGHLAESSSGLTNVMADVYQAVMTVVLVELNDGRVSVSFRCQPPYSVAELALNLGGGGHQLAAGCTMDGPLDKAEALVVALSKEAIWQQAAIYKNGHGDCH